MIIYEYNITLLSELAAKRNENTICYIKKYY